jgi:hypothetical protein
MQWQCVGVSWGSLYTGVRGHHSAIPIEMLNNKRRVNLIKDQYLQPRVFEKPASRSLVDILVDRELIPVHLYRRKAADILLAIQGTLLQQTGLPTCLPTFRFADGCKPTSNYIQTASYCNVSLS